MGVGKERIQGNLRKIQDQIQAACARSGRSPREVTLVAVTKSGENADIRHLVELGVTELAESRAQQLAQRAEELAPWLAQQPGGANVRWHMVGHLQRNKVRQVLSVSRIIHSVDSLRLAEEINARCERMGWRADILLEVNCSQESQKFGCAVGAMAHLAEMLCTFKNTRLVGLMTMAPQTQDPQGARPTFVRLRELFDEMRQQHIGGADMVHLSMGMSHDFPVAIEEGATMLRIGSALFE